jgi:eukaryotic-like serine/threonine-protein kinase
MTEPNAAESPVKEGDILAGKYRVEKVLGVGGMGVVVAAMHTELDERVALKFLLPSAAQNPAVVARFSREAKAAAKIKSQHVARVIDVGTLENGTPYIVMEYLDGIDLSDLLTRDTRLPVSDAVDYVLQAGEAIAEAHAAGFVHRDLKPANLFLANQSDGTAIVKVLDFGISKAVLADEPAAANGALTRTTDIFGSPMYMSPEQLKSSRDVDARADIWALGVILYELIGGRAPFDRPTVAETFGAILYEKPPSLRKQVPELPEELERVIFHCLEKDLNARTANVGELSKALFPFAVNATRASLDRTSRVLRRAGVTVESVPPPAFDGARASAPDALSTASARAQSNASPGAQTRTAWDTASQVQRPHHSGARTALIGAVMVLFAGGGGLLAWKRLGHPASGTTTVAPVPATSATQAAPVVSASTAVAVVSAAPLEAPPAVASSAPVTVTPAPHGRGGGRGRKADVPPPVVTPALPAAPVAPPVKPAAKPGDDPDGFGDRK